MYNSILKPWKIGIVIKELIWDVDYEKALSAHWTDIFFSALKEVYDRRAQNCKRIMQRRPTLSAMTSKPRVALITKIVLLNVFGFREFYKPQFPDWFSKSWIYKQ